MTQQCKNENWYWCIVSSRDETIVKGYFLTKEDAENKVKEVGAQDVIVKRRNYFNPQQIQNIWDMGLTK